MEEPHELLGAKRRDEDSRKSKNQLIPPGFNEN